jgi:hypothetical protein
MSDEIREQQREYREAVRFFAAPLLEDARMNWNSAVQFAKLGIWVGFLANAGGFILLPAYVAIFGREPALTSRGITFALTFFALGILVTWLITFFAFFSARIMAEAHSTLYESVAGKQARLYFPDWRDAPSQSAIEDKEDNSHAKVKLSNRLLLVAIICAFGSLACFLAGAGIAVRGLI